MVQIKSSNNSFNRISKLLLNKSLMVLVFCCWMQVSFAQNNGKPNIIFILADDMGYGDIAALNKSCKIKTPNLDKMYQSGLAFTDAHGSSAVCTPSRYGILTGRYNWRSTLKNGVLGTYGKPLIASDRTTLPAMLKKQGYTTACIGKWHLGMNWKTRDGQAPLDTEQKNNLDYSAAITDGPIGIGFDYFYGVDAPNYPPYCFIENEHLTAKPDTFYKANLTLDCRAGSGIKNWSLKDVLPTLQQKSINYVDKMSKSQKPFFAFLPITAPHTPIVPTEEFLDKSGLNIYADFVMQVDAYVGQIVAALEKNNALNNTIIVFTSDNGCSPRANFAELLDKGHNPNYVFRGNKADIYEGGHRVPCLVQWPAKIKGGKECKQTICLDDFMATFANITGYKFADNEAEDSYNILPYFKNPESKTAIREAIVHHSINGSFSIRKGKWKLELTPGSGGWTYPRPGKEEKDLPVMQLYDVENDIAETQNIVDKHPEIVKELTALLTKYVEEGRSIPGKPQANEGSFIKERMQWMTN